MPCLATSGRAEALIPTPWSKRASASGTCRQFGAGVHLRSPACRVATDDALAQPLTRTSYVDKDAATESYKG